jgi:signal transduction histidine kinase
MSQIPPTIPPSNSVLSALNRAYSLAVGDTLHPVSTGLAVLYLFFAGSHYLLLPAAMRWPMVGLAFGSAIFLATLGEGARRHPQSGQRAHAGAALIASVVLVNSAVHLLLSRDVFQSTNLILLVVGIGIFFLSARWLVGALLVVYVTWAISMLVIGGDSASWTHYSFGLLSATLLAILAQNARKRMLRRVTLLRIQDEARTEQLQTALVAEQATEAELRKSEERYRLLNAELTRHVQELDKANAELGRAARLKDEFLATVSHELRTPLNAILGLNESLRDDVYGPLNDRQQEALGRMAQSGQHLLSLINDILDVAKIEAGKDTLDLLPTPVPALCQASLDLIRPVAEKKQLTLTVQLDPAVTVVLADERRLKQVLVNLLTNAVKFTPAQGTIGLEVTGDPDNHCLQFTVWDTGIGIAPANFERLFKPFVQLDSRLARSYTGTGLGLVLVHRLVELHGGSVAVESQLNAGSRFTITLPWRVPVTEPPCIATNSTDQRPTTASPASVILVADDQEAHLNWLATIAPATCQVVTATSRRDALAQAQTLRPTLLLVDQRLSQLDAQELVDSFRYEPALAETPIIITTALDLPGAREQWLATGARGYWRKPIGPQKLTKFLVSSLFSR